MKTSSSTLKVFLLLTVGATLAACAPSTNESADFASRDPSLTTPQAGGNKAIAVCNQASSGSFTVQMKAGVDANNRYRMDQVLLKFSNLPSGFTSGSEYINLWRWMASSASSTYMDQVALNFYLYDTVSRQAITGWKNALQWSDISNTASTWGLSAESFFQRVVLVVDVRDTAGEYDVLKLASYSGGTVTTQLDILLPLFYANPLDYAYESNGAARPSILKALHPFKDMASQGWTTNQYQAAANAFCF